MANVSLTPHRPAGRDPGPRWLTEGDGPSGVRDTLSPSDVPLPPLHPRHRCRRPPGRTGGAGNAAAALFASEPETEPRSPAADLGCRDDGSGPPSQCG